MAGVPVVDVGDRQKGRLRLGGVADVPARADAVADAVRGALAKGRDPSQANGGYSDGPAAPGIVAALRAWDARCLPGRAFREVPWRG